MTRKGEARAFKGFYRTFNHDLYSGGRVYGGCEQMPEPDRLKLLFNGAAVSEIDITACQPSILYGLYLSGSGILPFGDAPVAYDFYNAVVDKLGGLLSREQVKTITSRALGNAHFPKLRWPKGAKVDGCKWDDIAPAFMEVMPFLDLLHPESCNSVTLQNTESNIMFDTIWGLYKFKGIPVLPVHDGLVVAKDNTEFVVKALSNSFWFKTGVVPFIKIKN